MSMSTSPSVHLTPDQKSHIKDLIDSDKLWEAKEAVVKILEQDRRQGQGLRYEKGLRVGKE